MFNLMEMKVLKFDDNLFTDYTPEEYDEHILNSTAYSVVPFKPKLDPSNGWAVPYVTNHKYKLHWRYGLDFEQMQIDLSKHWKSTDKDIYLVMNHTDVRAKVDVITGGERIENMTLVNKSSAAIQAGDNIIYNDTETR